jgi:hypothetical protein
VYCCLPGEREWSDAFLQLFACSAVEFAFEQEVFWWLVVVATGTGWGFYLCWGYTWQVWTCITVASPMSYDAWDMLSWLIVTHEWVDISTGFPMVWLSSIHWWPSVPPSLHCLLSDLSLNRGDGGVGIPLLPLVFCSFLHQLVCLCNSFHHQVSWYPINVGILCFFFFVLFILYTIAMIMAYKGNTPATA